MERNTFGSISKAELTRLADGCDHDRKKELRDTLVCGFYTGWIFHRGIWMWVVEEMRSLIWDMLSVG